MPRNLVVGNGQMLVNLDSQGMLRDFYFPHVGLEEHTTGHIHHIGIYDESTNDFTWLHEDDWQAEVDYLDDTLIGHTIITSQTWQLKITINDFVTVQDNIFCRKLKIENLSETEKNLRLFFHYDFHIYGNKSNDTVFFSPGHNALIYYNRQRYFLVHASKSRGIIDQFATGKAEYQGADGTWRDAEDGELSMNPIAQGSVDATFGVHLSLSPQSSEEMQNWVTAGTNLEEVYELDLKVKTKGFTKLISDTKNYWHRWVHKLNTNYQGLPDSFVKLYKRSLMIIRTQIDRGGAIIAANDTDIRQFNKDDYSYMWPRDGALVANALDNAGYTEVTAPFFKFCSKIQSKEGMMLHKYNPDGSLGSSWHPWILKDCPQSPLQEDETALPIMALWNHYRHTADIEYLHYIYDHFVIKAADFLLKYRDPQSKLPLPSYDLWEEQHGVFTFTTAAVYAGLSAASQICDTLGSFTHRDTYKTAASEMKEAALKYLYSEEHNRFLKKINFENGEVIEADSTIDSSICGIFLFDLLPADDKRVISTMEQFPEALAIKDGIGGFARYQKDHYQRPKDCPPEIPGNPWIITTLWYAQWSLQVSKSKDDPKYTEAIKLIEWVVKQATKSQILPEQIHYKTGQHLSVSPLTWSHSTYLNTIHILRDKMKKFGLCKGPFIPPVVHGH